MKQLAPLSHVAFRALTGSPWQSSAVRRQAKYEALFLTAANKPKKDRGSIRPRTVLGFASQALELFSIEPDLFIRHYILGHLSDALGRHQQRHEGQNFSPFYAHLGEVLKRNEEPLLTPKLLSVGLGLISLEKQPSCGNFLDHMASFISCELGKKRNGRGFLGFLLHSTRKVESITLSHPALVTPAYIEACCNMLKIQPPPIASRSSWREQPHQKLQREKALQKTRLILMLQLTTALYLGKIAGLYTLHIEGSGLLQVNELFTGRSRAILEEQTRGGSNLKKILENVLHDVRVAEQWARQSLSGPHPQPPPYQM